MRGALGILKLNGDEQARQNFNMAVTLVAPVKLTRRNPAGMQRKVADRLDLDRKAEYFSRAVAKRDEIDGKHSEWLQKGYDKVGDKGYEKTFQSGDEVACKHGVGLVTINPRPGMACSVLVRGNEDTPDHEVEFESLGKGPGGARLRHLPISFATVFRKLRKDAVPKETRAAVVTYAHEKCPVSPCAKDSVRRWTGPTQCIKRQARKLMTTRARLYQGFKTENPTVKLALNKFKDVLRKEVWELRKSKVESCLCKSCENFQCYEEALTEAASRLKAVYTKAEEEANALREEAVKLLKEANPSSDPICG
jgi:hypothetical protein